MDDASAKYDEAVSKAKEGSDDDGVQAMWDAAVAYNESLLTKSDRFFPSDADMAEYLSLLDPARVGVMGQVVIPKLGIDLPIYHTTNADVLSAGIGHIPGTSLPVGGASTHCVISGHRGLPDSELFTNIDQLVEGDTFQLRVLGRTLTYQVDQIRIILPNEITELAIEPGEDLCTLVTCTPYGVNTHRLLVRGHRVANAVEAGNIPADATQVDVLVEEAGFFCVGLVIAWAAYLVREHGVRARHRELKDARKHWGLK